MHLYRQYQGGFEPLRILRHPLQYYWPFTFSFGGRIILPHQHYKTTQKQPIVTSLEIFEADPLEAGVGNIEQEGF